MKYNLPTLDHAQVKVYIRRLGVALSSQINMYESQGQTEEALPANNARIALLAMMLSKKSGFTHDEFNQFTVHADLFHKKENKLEEHPYSFTLSEHILFNLAHSLVSDIISAHPVELLVLGQRDEERFGANRAAELVMENFQ